MKLEQIIQNSRRPDSQDPFTPQDLPQRILSLMRLSQHWRTLDSDLKAVLPANLHPHCQVSCMENGTLLIRTPTQMAATRLRMLLPSLLPELQAQNPHIHNIKILVKPQTPEPVRPKNFHISDTVLETFSQSADRLHRHPELAQALRNLVRNQRRG